LYFQFTQHGKLSGHVQWHDFRLLLVTMTQSTIGSNTEWLWCVRHGNVWQ